MRGLERQSDAYTIVSGTQPHQAAALPTDAEVAALGLHRSGPAITAGMLRKAEAYSAAEVDEQIRISTAMEPDIDASDIATIRSVAEGNLANGYDLYDAVRDAIDSVMDR
ncbi:hypothetical protein SEA_REDWATTLEHOG_42 [Gordonia phage RedWattleHog]|uniref:Uncharacterized protein n=1 Tax=Gordonia phage Stormageddon TaxID=2656541 RepID=A0A649VSH9_9CAUD|nr:hypothetical protein KHQ86_gp039 [Gordonia phage Stormageddon]QGJ94902.1 hypothetical protein SEA_STORMAGEDDON_39 [Gordonia phage Stormageddon]QLF83546.1 hypothetical protein SEA_REDWATTLEHOG_42 [Gordonia phage RedWattleHog]